MGGSRQPRGGGLDPLLARALREEAEAPRHETEGDGSGFLTPADWWNPPPPQPGAAPAYFLRVRNVVATCSTDAKLDPALVAALLHGRYDVHVFPAATIPLASPFCTISYFPTGNCVITGSRMFLQALLAGYLFLNTLSYHTRRTYSLWNFHVQNVVASAALGRRINLAALQRAHEVDTTYEPDTFAGLQYRPKTNPDPELFWGGRPVVGVFDAGCLVFCGGRSEDHLVAVFRFMCQLLEPFLEHPDAPASSPPPTDQSM